MKLFRIGCFYTVWLCMGVAFSALAMPPVPKDKPSDKIALGNARVKAWRALRLDLDTLNHGDVHPALVYQWLDAASPLVLRHIAGHGMDPTLVLAATERMVSRKTANVSQLKALSKKWAHRPRLPWFEAMQVRAGDRDRIAVLERELNARSDVIRVSAAVVFAIAGEKKGKNLLLQQVTNCGTQVRRAANVLGAIGIGSDRFTMEKSIAAGCNEVALRRASGEIHFRISYPEHYDLLVRRDSSDTRYQAENGMYAAWFDLARYAAQKGVSSRTDFMALIKGFRDFKAVWPHQSAEVSRRHVDALVGFFGTASALIGNRDRSVPWPQSWSDALKNLGDESHAGFGNRVSAAFAVLRWTEDLTPFKSARIERTYTILSPRGNRVSDDNWASSWQGKKGANLVLEWSPAGDIASLWLAAGCVDGAGSGLAEVKIRITSEAGKTEKNVTLNPRASYYQSIPINAKAVRRMNIEIVSTTNRKPACINELRAKSF